MKNFFKKLSFVMALAMVLTALAPAVAGADASYIYKKGQDTQKEAVEVWFGDEEKKLDLNVKINGKKTTDGTWKIGNTKIATIDKETGVVTPVKNGTTTAKFTDAEGNYAKVKVVVGTRAAGIKVKDNGTAITELAMTVGEAKELKFGAYISNKAKNAGATKASQEVAMTVEGEAVTTAVDGKYVTVTAAKAGEATLTFTAGKKTATVAVTVVDALAAKQTGAAKITVTGSDLSDNVADYAVKRGTVVVNFKSVALNEEKTEAVLTAAASKLTKGAYTLSYKKSDAVEFTVVDAVVSSIEITSDSAVLKTGKTDEATANFVVKNQFGENVTAANMAYLTVSGATPSVDAVTGLGVATFKSTQAYTPNLSVVALTVVCNTNGVNASKTLTVVPERTLATVEYVGLYTNALGYWAPATLKESMTAEDLASVYVVFAAKDQYGNVYTDPTNLNVIVSGVPGVNVTGTVTLVNYTQIGYQLTSNYETGLMAGTSNAMAIVKTNGNTAQGTIEVAPKTKVASIAITSAEIYGGQWNTVDYEILDTNGEPVTSYVTLKAFQGLGYLPETVRFTRNADGTAKMQVWANSVVYDTPMVMSLRSETNVFTTVSLTVRPDCVATAIGGLDKTVILGALAGNPIVIDTEDVVVLDQYGNVCYDEVTLVASIADPAKTGAFDSITATGGAITVDTVAGKIGNGELTIAIDGVENSEATFTIVATNIEKVSNFAVLDTNLLHANTTGNGIVVVGTVGATTVVITPDYYTVVDNTSDDVTVDTPVIYNNGIPTTKSLTFSVTIKNKVGTVVTKTVEYSDVPATVTTVKLPVTAAIVTGDTLNQADLLNLLVIKDQYNEVIGDANARVQVSGMTTATAKVNNNNTKYVEVVGLTAADVSIHAVYTFSNGLVFECDIPVVIE